MTDLQPALSIRLADLPAIRTQLRIAIKNTAPVRLSKISTERQFQRVLDLHVAYLQLLRIRTSSATWKGMHVSDDKLMQEAEHRLNDLGPVAPPLIRSHP